MKIFVDNDVILDVLLERKNYICKQIPIVTPQEYIAIAGLS